MADQEPVITIISRNVIAADHTRITLEWALSEHPDPEWLRFFGSGAGKNGTYEFVMTQPEITGNLIRMTVPDRDLEACATWMAESVRLADEQFRARILPRRQREAEQRKAEAAAGRQRLEDARARLQALGD